jgi:hypothetical protein
MAHGDTQRIGGELGYGTDKLPLLAEDDAVDSSDVTDLEAAVDAVEVDVAELQLDDTVVVLTPGAAVAYDASDGHVATLAMSTDATQTVTITNLAAGEAVVVHATQNGAGSKALVFASTHFAGGTEPTQTATASAVDIYTVMNVGGQLYGFVVGQDLKA